MRSLLSGFAVLVLVLPVSGQEKEKAVLFEPWVTGHIANGFPLEDSPQYPKVVAYMNGIHGKRVRVDGIVSGLTAPAPGDGILTRAVTVQYWIHKKGSDQKPTIAKLGLRVRFADKAMNAKKFPINSPIVLEGTFQYEPRVANLKIYDAILISVGEPLPRKDGERDYLNKRGIKVEY